MLGYHPPGADPQEQAPPPRADPPRSRHPPGADPLGAGTPPVQSMLGDMVNQRMGGTHPTGMQTC